MNNNIHIIRFHLNFQQETNEKIFEVNYFLKLIGNFATGSFVVLPHNCLCKVAKILFFCKRFS